jgi:hypothetical protein
LEEAGVFNVSRDKFFGLLQGDKIKLELEIFIGQIMDNA